MQGGGTKAALHPSWARACASAFLCCLSRVMSVVSLGLVLLP